MMDNYCPKCGVELEHQGSCNCGIPHPDEIETPLDSILFDIGDKHGVFDEE